MPAIARFFQNELIEIYENLKWNLNRTGIVWPLRSKKNEKNPTNGCCYFYALRTLRMRDDHIDWPNDWPKSQKQKDQQGRR
jgi:hypothetical protein